MTKWKRVKDQETFDNLEAGTRVRYWDTDNEDSKVGFEDCDISGKYRSIMRLPDGRNITIDGYGHQRTSNWSGWNYFEYLTSVDTRSDEEIAIVQSILG